VTDADRFPKLVREACHDVRTPLATAYGFARTLERIGGLDEQQQRYLRFIVASCEEQTRLIDAVATLARREGGTLAAKLAPVDLGQAAVDAAADVEQRLGDGRCVALVNEPAAALVLADPEHVPLALATLAEAALRLEPALREVGMQRSGSQIRLGPISLDAMQELSVDDGRDVRVVAAHALLALSGVTFSSQDHHLVLDFAPALAAI
jgi:signal transduction histidine kinase